MRYLPFLCVLLLVGWVSCVCEKEPGSRYRTINNCPMNRMKRPMCGSDGCSYINGDALACAQQEDPQLEMVHLGMCDDGEQTDWQTDIEKNL